MSDMSINWTQVGLVGRQQQAQSAQRSTDFSGPHL
eukprot:CAMPEP_0181396676 /NCGR_PEP_ID=MMETSP1110-20121109/35_1 /TAXON_ID=174948 /ORGANISM="Symbiodinium sp., Strain CCMP421" /LENGTH=34 /DNA_ID= /DNA_START= /DNA_END= /DNA_ORIENTATION=